MALPGLTPNGRSGFDLPVQIALHHAPKQIREAHTPRPHRGLNQPTLGDGHVNDCTFRDPDILSERLGDSQGETIAPLLNRSSPNLAGQSKGMEHSHEVVQKLEPVSSLRVGA